MSRFVTHRWNLPSDTAPRPDPGAIVAGVRFHWRVRSVEPVESRKYPHAWKAKMEPLGPHGLSLQHLRERCLRGWWGYQGVFPEDPK